jgi:hypothetical protein
MTPRRWFSRTGTPVRARAFKEGMITSPDGTQTYLVGVDDVFKTIPTLSLVADSGEAFYKPHGIMSTSKVLPVAARAGSRASPPAAVQ